jgi:hypothetical protein
MFKATVAVLHHRVMGVLLDPGTEIQRDMVASKGVFSLVTKGDKLAKVSPSYKYHTYICQLSSCHCRHARYAGRWRGEAP